MISDNDQLTTKAYRNPTHMTRYLNFNLCPNFCQKVVFVKTLLFRATSKFFTNYRDKTNELDLFIMLYVIMIIQIGY